MSEDHVEGIRRHLIERLMAHDGISWTCSSERLVMRAHGGTLCKVGRDAERVLVEFRLEPEWAEQAEAATFVHAAPPGETPPERWRQAQVTSADEADQLLSWFFQK